LPITPPPDALAILAIAFAASCVHALPGVVCAERPHDQWAAIQPKAPIPVNKVLVAAPRPVADKCRSIDLFASIGGICRRRFTVPKYLGSMVRAASQSALAFKVGLQSCPVNLLNRKGSQLRVGRVRRNVRDQSVKLKEHKQLLPHYQWSKISMGVL